MIKLIGLMVMLVSLVGCAVTNCPRRHSKTARVIRFQAKVIVVRGFYAGFRGNVTDHGQKVFRVGDDACFLDYYTVALKDSVGRPILVVNIAQTDLQEVIGGVIVDD